MPQIIANVSCPVHESFRVQQVAGMFDVPLVGRSSESFSVEVPGNDEPWDIGLIVGPSGSGKTTIARAAFGDALYEPGDWPRDCAIIDALGDGPARELIGLLTAVGLSSPRSWIKPYHVLSGGERFRCELARALGEGLARSTTTHPRPNPLPAGEGGERPIVAFDEFTSVVDRNVARIGSAAVARYLRYASGTKDGETERMREGENDQSLHPSVSPSLHPSISPSPRPPRFVAISCHYDVAEWLEPDWVIDMAERTCQRRRLRRPPIELSISRCQYAAWRRFASHHYLTGQLSRAARCYLAAWQDEPVAFCATLPCIGRRGHWRISRIVTLPDYQGVGIGTRVMEAVAELHREEGNRVNVTASHPAVVAHCARSPHWRTVGLSKGGARRAARFVRGYRGSSGRLVASFEYVGK